MSGCAVDSPSIVVKRAGGERPPEKNECLGARAQAGPGVISVPRGWGPQHLRTYHIYICDHISPCSDMIGGCGRPHCVRTCGRPAPPGKTNA